MSQGVEALRPWLPICLAVLAWHTRVVGLLQQAVVAVKVVRLLTLESSLTLASDQLRSEEGVLFEQFASPTVFFTGRWKDAFIPFGCFLSMF